MLNELSNAIIMFGGGLALLIAFVQLFHDRSRIKNILLFVIFTSLAIIHMSEFFASVTPGYQGSIARDVLLIAKFILGPSMYIFYFAVFTRGYRPGLAAAFHFIPVLIALLYVIFSNAAAYYNTGIIFSVMNYMDSRSVYEYLHTTGFVLIFGYISVILIKIEFLKVFREKRERLNMIAAAVVAVLFVVALLVIAAAITGSATVFRMALGLMTMFFIYWFAMSQIYPEIFSSSVKKLKHKSRRDESISGIDFNKLESGLHQLMDVEKLYCDEDLSLRRLADLLSIQPHQFSLYLNQRLNMNFNVYVNTCRVNHAIQLMDEERRRPILDIAFSSGFNSKSAFYDAFTKQTGLSPAKYRKQFFPAKKS